MTLAVIDALDASIRGWGAQFSWPVEYGLRLGLAAVAGALVGIEREARGRQAGFRTNLLVSVGSALLVIISITFAERSWPHSGEFNVNVDPARVAYGIMTGIGFLGAGTIMKHDGNVRGLTTAAAMWCVAAVGMAAGLGMYTLAAVTTVMVVGALWILDYVELLIPKTHHRMLVIRRKWESECIGETVNRLQRAGLRVHDVSFRRTENLLSVDISMRAAFKNLAIYDAFQRQLEQDRELELISSQQE